MKQVFNILKKTPTTIIYLHWVILICFLNNALHAQINTGPKTASVITSGSCSFSYSSLLNYAPVTSVQLSDNVYATAVHCGCCDANTNCLRLTNFGFTIPAGASITGISVDVEKRCDFGAHAEDNGLRLLSGGTEVGLDKANFGTPWPWIDTKVTYGGCNDVWGTVWTPAQINAANFGLVFASIDYSCAGDVQSFIDEISISICYTLPLPLDQLVFKADKWDKQVKLNWQLGKHALPEQIVIERAGDAGVFLPMDSVRILFDEVKITDYTWSDVDPLQGNNYYRLRLQKKNGIYNYSDIQRVVFSEERLKLSPNPARDRITLTSDVRMEKGGLIELYSAASELVLSKYWDSVPAEINSRTVEIGHLPDGMYYCKWQTDHTVQWYKFIKSSGP
ncbi:MAG: hypothetical protein QM534_03335 [Sediminibacterium sp.]|nr:hypothetical protein [Sediminibacterium sp.]